MGLTNSLNIRLEPEIKERLENLSDQTGIKSSVLIRQAISEYLDQVEKTGRLEIRINTPNSKTKKTA